MVDRLAFPKLLLQTADPSINLDGLSRATILREAEQVALLGAAELRDRASKLRQRADSELASELSPHQQAQYESQLETAQEQGKWSKDLAEAHYVEPSGNGFKTKGVNCQNCLHFRNPNLCEVVAGRVDRDGMCKLWVIPASTLGRYDSYHADTNAPTKRVLKWNGLSIGITHEEGRDSRFGRLMQGASYGHIRKSYGQAEDGKAIDVYVGPSLSSTNIFKVHQRKPDGTPDETKLMIGFSDIDQARDTFISLIPSNLFGLIEPTKIEDYQAYREDSYHADNCGCEACQLREHQEQDSKPRRHKKKTKCSSGCDDDTEEESEDARQDADSSKCGPGRVFVPAKNGRKEYCRRDPRKKQREEDKPKASKSNSVNIGQVAATVAGVGLVGAGVAAIAASQSGNTNSPRSQKRQTKPGLQTSNSIEDPWDSDVQQTQTVAQSARSPQQVATNLALPPVARDPDDIPKASHKVSLAEYQAGRDKFIKKLDKADDVLQAIESHETIRRMPLPAAYDSYEEYEEAIHKTVERGIDSALDRYNQAKSLHKQGLINDRDLSAARRDFRSLETRWTKYLDGKAFRPIEERIQAYRNDFSESSRVERAGDREIQELREWDKEFDLPQFKNTGVFSKERDSLSYAGAIIQQAPSKPENFRGVRDSKGRLQAGALITEKPDHLLVNYLATAPHNLVSDHPDRVKGSGLMMIASLIEESIATGKRGKLVLDGISGTGSRFYELVGFDKGTLSSESAQKLLKQIKEQVKG